MQVDPAVRRNAQQAVVTVAARRVVGLADPEADDFRAISCTATLQPVGPAETLCALLQRLAQVGAGHLLLPRPVQRIADRRIDQPDPDAIHLEIDRRFVEQGLDGGRDLVLARPALRPLRRRVGHDRDRTKAHGLGLIDERRCAGGSRCRREPGLAADVLDDEQVHRGDPAVVAETHFDVALETGPRLAEIELLGAAEMQGDRPVDLAREEGRQHEHLVWRAARAEAAAAVFIDENELFDVDAQPAGQTGHWRRLALVRAVQEALAVLPVRHRRARLHRVVRVTGSHEVLFDDVIGVRKTFVDVADRPLDRHVSLGRAAFEEGVELFLRPLDLFGFRRRIAEALRRVHIALFARVGARRAQRLERVDAERQRLILDIDFLQRVRRDGVVDGRDCENRVTDEHRVVGQDRGAWRLGSGDVIRRQHADHAVHRQRGGQVHALDAGMGHGAAQEAREDHPVDVYVLGVTRLARHLADDVRRREVAADVVGHAGTYRKLVGQIIVRHMWATGLPSKPRPSFGCFQLRPMISVNSSGSTRRFGSNE